MQSSILSSSLLRATGGITTEVALWLCDPQVFKYLINVVLYTDSPCLKMGKYGLANADMMASIDLEVTNIYHFFNAFYYEHFILKFIDLCVVESYTSSS